VLNDSNFDDALKANPQILVEFYAPWCGHCQNLAPEYAKAATKLSVMTPRRVLGKLDADADTGKKIAEKYKVKGFPTLYWLDNGTQTSYDGGNTSEEIISWVLKKTSPPSSEIAECDQILTTTDQNKLNLVYFGEKNT
jgi:protein disulfide-isomerase-like protein